MSLEPWLIMLTTLGIGRKRRGAASTVPSTTALAG